MPCLHLTGVRSGSVWHDLHRRAPLRLGQAPATAMHIMVDKVECELLQVVGSPQSLRGMQGLERIYRSKAAML